MYCNGPDEHYIDLACPVGKTNSTLEFCPPVALLAKSIVRRLSDGKGSPVLGTYVDDIFGGLPHEESLARALRFRNYICESGKSLTLRFNKKETKNPYPAKTQVILGNLYDSERRHVRTSDDKRAKYLQRIQQMLQTPFTTVKDVQKLHCNLNFAAQVAPFCRPFLAHMTNAVKRLSPNQTLRIPEVMKMSLRIWSRILTANRGVSFDFVLGNLKRAAADIFVDAATEWGIGGLFGAHYFRCPWTDLQHFGTEFIAQKELLAALVALVTFGDQLRNRIVRLYSDNTCTVQ